MNGTRLWDGITSSGNSKVSPNNVWNSYSYLSGGFSIYDGVDIDTLGLHRQPAAIYYLGQRYSQARRYIRQHRPVYPAGLLVHDLHDPLFPQRDDDRRFPYLPDTWMTQSSSPKPELYSTPGTSLRFREAAASSS